MSQLIIESWTGTFDENDGKKFEKFDNVVSVAPFGQLGFAVTQRQPNGLLATKVVVDYHAIIALYIEETNEDRSNLGLQSGVDQAAEDQGPRIITDPS